MLSHNILCFAAGVKATGIVNNNENTSVVTTMSQDAARREGSVRLAGVSVRRRHGVAWRGSAQLFVLRRIERVFSGAALIVKACRSLLI